MAIHKFVQVSMRDGVALATDVYRPTEEGRYPTLVNRLPYNKDTTVAETSVMHPPLVAACGATLTRTAQASSSASNATS